MPYSALKCLDSAPLKLEDGLVVEFKGRSQIKMAAQSKASTVSRQRRGCEEGE